MLLASALEKVDVYNYSKFTLQHGPYSVADLAKSVLQVGAFKSTDKNYDRKNNFNSKTFNE